ncbi:MAG: Cys-tRNA(Pro) deacylase [Clostridiales bacterium]|nr:Cys-tRNA(Pro) deacylase [Candidatus Coliplasma caballi]
MAKQEEKTNAMRMLDVAGLPYTTERYEVDESDLSGVHAASVLGLDPDVMFKTLVAKGDKRGYLVFVIPVAEELDLKKCARAAGDKRVELIPVKDLLPLTGYLRGGCSPVGMKKKFPTYFDETVLLCDRIYVSAGQRGRQLCVNAKQFVDYLEAETADLTVI